MAINLYLGNASSPRLITFLAYLTLCGFDSNKLYPLYQKLSNEIHGRAWSGPSIQVYMRELTTEEGCLLVSIIEQRDLPYEKAVLPVLLP